MGLLYKALYNDLMKEDLPLPEGPKRITLQLFILDEGEEVKYIVFSVSNLYFFLFSLTRGLFPLLPDLLLYYIKIIKIVLYFL